MTKGEFLLRLGEGLSGTSKELINEQLDFYSEIIDDRIEEGLTEEEAVLEIGDIDAIISQIKEEKSISDVHATKGKLEAWKTVLLILGSPTLLSIIITITAIVFSLFISLWVI